MKELRKDEKYQGRWKCPECGNTGLEYVQGPVNEVYPIRYHDRRQEVNYCQSSTEPIDPSIEVGAWVRCAVCQCCLSNFEYIDKHGSVVVTKEV